MDPVTIAALSGLVLKIVDWAQTKGYTPDAAALEQITALRKAAVAKWDSLKPADPGASGVGQ